jgi:hypothetical protein
VAGNAPSLLVASAARDREDELRDVSVRGEVARVHGRCAQVDTRERPELREAVGPCALDGAASEGERVRYASVEREAQVFAALPDA